MPSPRRLLSDLSVKIRSVFITQAPGLLARGLSRFSADSFDCDFTALFDGVPAVAGDRHVLGEVPERDAGPLLGRLHSGHLRPHHQGGPEGGGESYGESHSKCPPKSRHGPDAETPRPGIVFAPYRTGYWMCLDATCRSFL